MVSIKYYSDTSEKYFYKIFPNKLEFLFLHITAIVKMPFFFCLMFNFVGIFYIVFIEKSFVRSWEYKLVFPSQIFNRNLL